jgi:phosphatidate phosphatase PAH1
MVLGAAGEAFFVRKLSANSNEAFRDLQATSDQLRSLGLHKGENTITFTTNSGMQGI